MRTYDNIEDILTRHRELMEMVEEQIAIMEKINKGNIFTFMMDVLFYHRYETAHTLACQYLEEGCKLLIATYE